MTSNLDKTYLRNLQFLPFFHCLLNHVSSTKPSTFCYSNKEISVNLLLTKWLQITLLLEHSGHFEDSR